VISVSIWIDKPVEFRKWERSVDGKIAYGAKSALIWFR
jgi:hypothetical protein